MKKEAPVEKWVPVQGYEEYYNVSSYGNILGKKRERILKQGTNRYGYKYVTLSKEGAVKNKTVHRLVATAFIPNLDQKPQINHKNGIKTDNTVVNLEWCSCSENHKHAFQTGIKRLSDDQLAHFERIRNRNGKCAKIAHLTALIIQ